jgi:hypothetical protein
MPAKIVTLTTDFGLRDPYVAEMKAVILGICPTAIIIDITHEVEKFNVRMGAYILASAAQHFPEGTIHVAVIDPEVGTQRQPLLIQTKRGFFVGPDNGLLTSAAHKQGIIEIIQITNRKFMLPKISSTFHGRDVFAPAAAYIAVGIPPNEFGSIALDSTNPDFVRVIHDGTALIGEVMHIDGFGNIITNVSEKEMKLIHLENSCSIEICDRQLGLKIGKTYGDSRLNQPLALVGSHGYLEIAVVQGSAAQILAAKVGDRIRITKV